MGTVGNSTATTCLAQKGPRGFSAGEHPGEMATAS